MTDSTHEPGQQERSASEPGDQQGAATDTRTDTGIDTGGLRNYEQLRRSVTDRKIAGVAGGLGRHLNIDPTILRVLFVVLCFFGGAGFLLYGVAWLLVPEDGRSEAAISTSPGTRNALLIGAGVVGALLLIGDSWGGFGFPWPLVLIGVGVLIYLVVKDQRQTPQMAGGGYAPETSAAAWMPAQAAAQAPTQSSVEPPAQPPVPPAYAYQPPPPRSKRGPKLFGFTLAAVALALGTLGLFDTSGADVAEAAYPALALAVVGLMLVVGAWVGRAGGLIFLGLIAALALAVSSIGGEWGSQGIRGDDTLSVTPTSASAVRDSYFVPSGRAFIDLSEVSDPEALDGRSIDIGARTGELVVVLPEGVRSEVNADINGPGQVDLPDRERGGFDRSLEGTYGTGDATVTLDLHLFAGHIDVRNP